MVANLMLHQFLCLEIYGKHIDKYDLSLSLYLCAILIISVVRGIFLLFGDKISQDANCYFNRLIKSV